MLYDLAMLYEKNNNVMDWKRITWEAHTMSDDETIQQALARLKASLLPSFDIGGLFSRNNIAHKWKATFRSLLLREAIFGRLEDLVQQSCALHKMGHSLGALILLRSALEALATLIYLDQLTAAVLGGSLNFYTFSDKTAVLLLGSRNKTTDHSAINIQTVLHKCAKRYDLIERLYADLSEIAHPNHEGLLLGYSKPDRDHFIKNFANHWSTMYSKTHQEKMSVVIIDVRARVQRYLDRAVFCSGGMACEE